MALKLYNHKIGVKIGRDWTVILLLYAMIFFIGTTLYFMVDNYVLEGKLQNGVCETRH